MRQFIKFNLNDQTSHTEQWEGEALVKAGRHLIAKTLVEQGVATVDPLIRRIRLFFRLAHWRGRPIPTLTASA